MRFTEFISENKKPGLWANIHAKRDRIKNGSGEHMRKPGSKGAPTADALRKSATDEAANPKRQAAIAIAMKKAGKKPKKVTEYVDHNLIQKWNEYNLSIIDKVKKLGDMLYSTTDYKNKIDFDDIDYEDMGISKEKFQKHINQYIHKQQLTLLNFWHEKKELELNTELTLDDKIEEVHQLYNDLLTDLKKLGFPVSVLKDKEDTEGVAEGSLNELSSRLLQKAAQAATDKRNQAMEPELHNALGGGYMNPLATHYDNVSQKMDNRAAQVKRKETIKNIASQIASPAVMRKMGMAEQGLAEGMRKWLVIHSGSRGEGGKMIIKAPDFDTAWKLANEYDLDIIEVKPVKGVAEGAEEDMSKEAKAMATGKCPHCHGPVEKKEHPTLTQYHCAKCGIRASVDKQGVAEGSPEINWVKPNFDFEWHEVEEQSRMKQVPVDVRQYYQKHFPNKDAWLKAVQNGKAVVVPPDHAYEIRNAPFDKVSLQKVLAPTGHEGPIGPAKEKRVNDLFDKGQVEMPIILKTSQGLWLIGGKTRLGTANYVKGLPAKVWLISGEQGVAEAIGPDVMRHQGDKTIKIVKRAGKPIGEIGIDAEASSGIGSYYVKMYDGSYDAVGFDTAEEALAELKDIIKQTMAEGLPGSLSKSDYTPGATVKNPNTSCKRCNGRGTLWKAPDGKILPANDVPGAKKYKCGACDGIGMAKKEVDEGENWSKHNNKRVGGMSKKSVASYRRSHPGSKIQTAVTTKPSKLKKGSKAAKRRASFCARMRGMKKHRTGAKTANDPNSNINKSLRRWHCESIEELHELVMLAEQYIRNNKK